MSEKADPESQPEEKIDPKYWEDILVGEGMPADLPDLIGKSVTLRHGTVPVVSLDNGTISPSLVNHVKTEDGEEALKLWEGQSTAADRALDPRPTETMAEEKQDEED